jgi:hypothetical protein
MPDPELLRRFGIDLARLSAVHPAELSLRILSAARFVMDENDDSTNAPGVFTVGGFAQLTILRRASVQSEIVHRWPDTIGSRITPSLKDPPPSLMARNV